MVLVDTSVWIDHFRNQEPLLADLLNKDLVLTHRFVIEELSCGHLLNRKELLGFLRNIPLAPIAEHEEFLEFVERERLWGAGIGAIDAHLLASARLSRARIWSKDQAVLRAAKRLDLLPG